MQSRILAALLCFSYTSYDNGFQIMRFSFVNLTHYLHDSVNFPKAEPILFWLRFPPKPQRIIYVPFKGKAHYLLCELRIRRQRHNRSE